MNMLFNTLYKLSAQKWFTYEAEMNLVVGFVEYLPRN